MDSTPLIPVSRVQGSPIMIAAADLAGYNINRKSNLLMLPKNAKAAAMKFDGKPTNANKLPEHRGSHGGKSGPSYQDYVKDELKYLDDRFKADKKENPWSQEKLLSELEAFENKIKNDLLTGKSPPLCKECKAGQIP